MTTQPAKNIIIKRFCSTDLNKIEQDILIIPFTPTHDLTDETKSSNI